jgi:DEAD/DEAH box helicase domain-containing protein
MESWRALQSAHEGAVYLHRGTTFQVSELKLEEGVAKLEPFEGPYFTQPVLQSVIEPLYSILEKEVGPLSVTLGSVRVTDMVLGYRKKSLDGDKILETIELDLPPTAFETVGLRFDLPRPPSEEEWPILAPKVHALEHALTAMAPLFAGCDRNDLGSAWYLAFPDTLAPAVYIFDRFAGGMGLSEKLFAAVEELLAAAAKALSNCTCEAGCPKCLYTARCEISNDSLSKAGALDFLKSVQGILN